MSLLFLILLAGILWVGFVSNHIPKTGRAISSKGEIITATITNSNTQTDKPVTMRAEKDGRKFKVKLKPTEARLWIKGDSIPILLVENSREYRIKFNDYFRENEERIREASLEKLKIVEKYPISAKIVKYEKEDFDCFKKSSLSSQQISSFCMSMHLIDICTVVTAALGVAVVLWWKIFSPKTMDLIAGIIPVLISAWSIYSANTNCKRVLKKIRKT